MHPNVRKAHDVIWQKFYNEEVQQIYDCEIFDPVQYPTRDEIINAIPFPNSPQPINDPTLIGGWILAANLRGHRVTGEKEYADKARLLFEGLIRLSGLARTPGFIPRGSVPGLDVVYPNSSADQYTGFFYGMWRYCESPLATDEDKAIATKRIVDAARLIESFNHDVPCDDMRPSFYGDMSNIDGPGRCCRLLQTYRTAFLLSGDEHWEALYREKLEEQGRKRLHTYYRPEKFSGDRRACSWGLWQNQAAFRMLFETEGDPEIKAAYRRALDEEAKIALRQTDGWEACFDEPENLVIPDLWRAFWPEFVRQHPNHDRRGVTPPLPNHVFRKFMVENAERIPVPEEIRARAVVAQGAPLHPLQMLSSAMYAEDPEIIKAAAKVGLPMLTTMNMTRIGSAKNARCTELVYWVGVEAGLFPES